MTFRYINKNVLCKILLPQLDIFQAKSRWVTQEINAEGNELHYKLAVWFFPVVTVVIVLFLSWALFPVTSCVTEMKHIHYEIINALKGMLSHCHQFKWEFHLTYIIYITNAYMTNFNLVQQAQQTLCPTAFWYCTFPSLKLSSAKPCKNTKHHPLYAFVYCILLAQWYRSLYKYCKHFHT